tara:strand:- start:714 stop:836 length:123 start_codon:yes stop_codon:yes gene_type:complete
MKAILDLFPIVVIISGVKIILELNITFYAEKSINEIQDAH